MQLFSGNFRGPSTTEASISTGRSLAAAGRPRGRPTSVTRNMSQASTGTAR